MAGGGVQGGSRYWLPGLVAKNRLISGNEEGTLIDPQRRRVDDVDVRVAPALGWALLADKHSLFLGSCDWLGMLMVLHWLPVGPKLPYSVT